MLIYISHNSLTQESKVISSMEFSAYKLVYNFVNKPESYMELKARNVKEFVLEQPTILAFDGYTAVV